MQMQIYVPSLVKVGEGEVTKMMDHEPNEKSGLSHPGPLERHQKILQSHSFLTPIYLSNFFQISPVSEKIHRKIVFLHHYIIVMMPIGFSSIIIGKLSRIPED